MYKKVAMVFAGMTMLAFAGEKTVRVEVPKGAVKTSPGVYRHVDDSGKAWIYRKTPFGLSKSEENAPAAEEGTNKPGASETSQATPFGEVRARSVEEPEAAASGISKVVEEGDTIRFERASPFGAYKWTRNKSELTPSEKEAVERHRSTRAKNSVTKK